MDHSENQNAPDHSNFNRNLQDDEICQVIDQLCENKDIFNRKASPTSIVTTTSSYLSKFVEVFSTHRQFTDGSQSFLSKQLVTLLIKQLTKDVHEFSPEGLQLDLTCLRILLRDVKLHLQFSLQGGVESLSTLLDRVTQEYLKTGETTGNVHVIKEISNMVKKLCSVKDQVQWILSSGVVRSLVQLLAPTDCNTVLHCVLHTLIVLANSGHCLPDVGTSLDCIITILQDYELPSQKLASDLLRLLCSDLQVRDSVRQYLPVLLSLLSTDSVRLIWSVVWCLVQLCENDDMTRSQVRHLGGIPLLLALLQSDRAHCGRSNSLEVQTPVDERDYSRQSSFCLKGTVCTCLAELARNDINSCTIMQANGIHILGTMLLQETTEPNVKATVHLQANVLRALRFLFSLERNRPLFKRLFPPEIFEAFIDVGHYERKLTPYMNLAVKLNSLPKSILTDISMNIEALNHQREPLQHVGDYAILELLGFGAFGQVFKVRKTKAKTSRAYLAMKEVAVGVSPLWGKNKKDVMQSVGNVMNELNVVKEQLHHPNIVKYKHTFYQNDKLYIVMDLIDGAPLREHITSLEEKNEHFGEPRLWKIFIQMVQALRYLHKEKQIMHRDLSPNNVMLGDQDRVTITDFGLAKQKQKDCSQMMSVVGTILYSCPEIIKHEGYGEKADVWALGCLLYQMATLKPPFYSTNIISLAKLIVEARYEPIPTTVYSPLVQTTVARCLAGAPLDRPDIVGVAACIADQLLMHTDFLQQELGVKNKQLEWERRRVQKYKNNASNNHKNAAQPVFTPSPRNQSYTSDDTDVYNTDDNRSNMAARLTNRKTNGAWRQAVESDDDSYSSEADIQRRILPPYRQQLTVNCSCDSGVGDQPSPANPQLSPNPAPNNPQLSPALTVRHQLGPAHLSSDCTHSLSISSSPTLTIDPPGSPGSVNIGRAVQRSLSTPAVECGRQTTALGKCRPGSAGLTLTVSQSRVREVTDPVQQMLHQLHKIMYCSQLPPTIDSTDASRRLVNRYKRALCQNSNHVNLKYEMQCLLTLSPATVDLLTLQHAPREVTYDQLHGDIEDVLRGSGYYG